jgi:hypothetical protein
MSGKKLSAMEQRAYDKAMAKPEAQRNWIDRNTIAQFGPRAGADGVIVREYDDAGEMQRDMAKLLSEGWRIVSQSAATPKKGAARWLLGGFVFLNPKPVTTVVFSRVA